MIPFRISVLIVDDHPLVRDGLSSMLRNEVDIEVAGLAESASAAMALAEKKSFDVAIIDLTLKGRSGFDLLKDFSDYYPKTALLVLSMHEEVNYLERALSAGASGYIMKGEDTRNICTAIRTVNSGEIYASKPMLTRLAARLVGRQVKVHADTTDPLSDRELDVFRLLGQGFTTRRIATDLQISMKTVQAHCANIKDKLRLTNVSELLREAVRWYEANQQGLT